MTNTQDLIIRERECQAAYDRLVIAEESLTFAESELITARSKRNQALTDAYDAGVLVKDIRGASDISRQRLHEIVNRTHLDNRMEEERLRIEQWKYDVEYAKALALADDAEASKL